MNNQILDFVVRQSVVGKLPVIKTGMTVRVSQKVIEGKKERVQVFEGLVIATHGGQSLNATFTVRRINRGIGVEKTFPLISKNLRKIEVIKQAKVQRAKLYFMRERAVGKASRLKGEHLQQVIFDADKKAEAKEEKAGETKEVKAEKEEKI